MPIRIRQPRNLSKVQIALGLTIGIISGAYIYQPYFLKQKQLKQEQLKLEGDKIAKSIVREENIAKS